MLSESEQSAIIRSLENILADEKFAGSPQMSAFLRYVVTETLQGNADRIKAYTVAVDALGKSDSFDPQNDPSVRVLAKRLRTSLGQYYERTANHEKIIEIKAGSYKPIFSEPEDASGSFTEVTPIESKLPELRDSQAVGIPADKPSSNQWSGNSGIAALPPNSDNNESAVVVASADENHTNSGSASKSTESALNSATATLPELASQKAAISSLRKDRWKQAEQPITTESDKGQTEVKKAMPKNSSLVTKFLFTAQAYKSITGTLALVTLGVLMWGFNQLISESKHTETASTNIQDTYALQLASASTVKPSRLRPAIPTIVVRTDSRDDKISQSLLSSISHVLSKFDNFQVLRTTHEYELMEKWPEDYEIVVDTLIMNDSNKITVNLINSASGRLAYSDELFLNGDVATNFSKNNIAAVELFVARIVQNNGPLFSDYRNQEKYSETMACVFSIRSSNDENHTSEDCLDKVNSLGQSESIQHALRAELSLINLAKKGSSKRKVALQNALAAAQKNLELAPHSAEAHALMMRVLQLSGDYSGALKHGNYAMGINDLDSSYMLAFAVLLDEMKKPTKADDMRKQASVLSTTLSDISF